MHLINESKNWLFIWQHHGHNKDYAEPRVVCQMPLQWFSGSDTCPHLSLQVPRGGYHDMAPVLRVFILLVTVLYSNDSFVHLFTEQTSNTCHVLWYIWPLSASENGLTGLFLHHISKYWPRLFKFLLKLAFFYIYIHFAMAVYSGVIIHIL